jgi:hypothetical protein
MLLALWPLFINQPETVNYVLLGQQKHDERRIAAKRIYFDETRARITRRVSEVKEEIQQGINDYSLTNATSAINDIKEEIVNLKSGRDNLSEIEYEFYFLQYQIEIEFMTELIEEIDVAFVTFMLLGEKNG